MHMRLHRGGLELDGIRASPARWRSDAVHAADPVRSRRVGVELGVSRVLHELAPDEVLLKALAVLLERPLVNRDRTRLAVLAEVDAPEGPEGWGADKPLSQTLPT